MLRRGGGNFGRAEFLDSAEAGDYHPVTVSNTLSDLVKEGYLSATGERRGRRYLPGPRFGELGAPPT